MSNKIISWSLVLVIIILAFFIYRSINKPIQFQKEKEKRYAAVINRLKDIRTAQLAFQDKYGRYTADFDTLINFIKFDSLPLVMAVGTAPDTMTEDEALKLKLIIRDTLYIAVKDTIFPKGFIPDSLPFIPFTDGYEFYMQAGKIETGSKVLINVFEVVDTHPFDPLNILQIGSMYEASTSGNWE